jgi:FkbM family methyltransferase
MTNSEQDKQIIVLNNKDTHILPQVNLQYYSTNGLFEQSLIDWCKQLCDKNKLFLDIGAHSGTYTVSLAQHCKEVHSFEPQRMTYYSLCGSVALSGIQHAFCHNFGLGSETQVGLQTLKIISNDGGGSSLNTAEKVLKEETIVIKTLDELNLQNIGFIKMDIEGNELNALKGATNTLKLSNFPKILFESNSENKELFDFIKNLGYTVININGYQNMFLAIYN